MVISTFRFYITVGFESFTRQWYDSLMLLNSLPVKMRDLSEIKVTRIVTFIENGVKIRQVARNFNRSPSVIKRVFDRYRTTGEYKRLAGQGRKRKPPEFRTGI